jgi:hypothetical protein
MQLMIGEVRQRCATGALDSLRNCAYQPVFHATKPSPSAGENQILAGVRAAMPTVFPQSFYPAK